MRGNLIIKTTSSGRELYYIALSYKDPLTGKWKSKTVSTGLDAKGNKRKAETLRREAESNFAYLELQTSSNAGFTPETPLTDYLDYWIELKKIDLKKITWEAYDARVQHMKRYFGDLKFRLIDITPRIVDQFFHYLLTKGKVHPKTKELSGLSVRSTRSYKSMLHAVFAQAMVEGLVSSNPVDCVAVRGKKNSDYSEDMLFLTEDEAANMLQFLSENYPRLMPIAFFGTYYGLRRSELLGLKWSAIDYQKKLIHIQHTVVRMKSTEISDLTKTPAGKRALGLFPTAEKCLEKIRLEQNENQSFFGKDYKNAEGYVFTWEDGRCYDPNYITHAFNKAMVAYGKPEISLHKLRHTCASMLINRGWDIKKVQYWLGHRDTQTTLNIYSHVNKQGLDDIANDLNEISSSNAGLFD